MFSVNYYTILTCVRAAFNFFPSDDGNRESKI